MAQMHSIEIIRGTMYSQDLSILNEIDIAKKNIMYLEPPQPSS